MSGLVGLPVGPGIPQVKRLGVRAEQVGQQGGCRSHLGVPVLRRLDDLRVQAKRRVVHEHATVHGGQVDRALHRVREGIERADDVIAVEAEVKREVVRVPAGTTT